MLGHWRTESARKLILDGAVRVFDRHLVSHMHLLMNPPQDEPVTPAVFMAPDLLALRGRDLRGQPLAERRATLERTLNNSEYIYPTRRLEQHGLVA